MEQIKKCDIYTLETVPKKFEMYYSETYGYNDGFFATIDELIDYCITEGEEIPDYIYGTEKDIIHLYAENIIGNACENLWEGAWDSISSRDIEELQEFLDKWCEKQTGTTSYCIDYNYKINIREYKNEKTNCD